MNPNDLPKKGMCECCKHEHDDCMVICRNCYESLLADSQASTTLWSNLRGK